MSKSLKSYIFKQIFTPLLAWHIRRKKKIRVLFVVQYLSEWKTEPLYLAMINHPRFVPIIGITPCIEVRGEDERMKKYCEKKKYAYTWISPHKTLAEQIHPDIVFHQKLYADTIYPKHHINTNRWSLFAYVPYIFNNIKTSWIINSYLTCNCWQIYMDNVSCCEEFKEIHKNHGNNFVVTGLPMMDSLLLDSSFYKDPWPYKDGRKRIIYAPHHTIENLHWEGVNYSSFLGNCDFMLQMADKYKNQAYFVFKPHPRLYRNLIEFWGKEKTDSYFNKWNRDNVSHIETGDYLDLFKHSDALIHDCGSFTLEYMYTGKPVMYLIKEGGRSTDNMTTYAKKAYNLHYKGINQEDIENFIQDVITGCDPMKEARLQFVADNLTPPYGKTACQNIINCILGKEEYK